MLRAWGWVLDAAPANTELVPRSQTGGFRQVQELVSTVTDVADQLRGYQDRVQLFDRLPERVRDPIAHGLVISSDVTTPQTSPEISIINLIVMHESDSSLAAQHETHDAALRWSTILAVATHIVEQQAPDLSPKEIIKALKTGLDAQSPADVRELLPQASVGDPLAMYRLARLLKQNGRPDEAQNGGCAVRPRPADPGALYTLGKLASEQGRHREAELWLRGAANAGHADAMYSLWMLLHDDDQLTASAWLRKAADAGNRDAMYQLWLLHQVRDEREAERWLRRAANIGHRQALADLSRLAAERGAEDDAVRWLRRAAEEGDSSAMSQYQLCSSRSGGASAHLPATLGSLDLATRSVRLGSVVGERFRCLWRPILTGRSSVATGRSRRGHCRVRAGGGGGGSVRAGHRAAAADDAVARGRSGTAVRPSAQTGRFPTTCGPRPSRRCA